MMNFSKKTLSQTVTQMCLFAGVDHIVISPGSRNAPLTIGFTQHPKFSCYSIVDERSAAFFALGMAQQLRRPVALVCTSGSALLNYYPAIAEAYYSNIPLVVISADRPKELIDVGDGQTIRQEDVYQNHIWYSANCREGEEEHAYNQDEIGKALSSAIQNRGPVHINVPFSEPLYGTTDELSVRIEARDFNADASKDLNESEYSQFVKDWNQAKRKMVLVGTFPEGAVDESILELLGKDQSVVVFTETTSNLHHPNFFPSIDKIIMPLDEDEIKELQPDILLTFGGMVVSKKIKAFLRENQPKAHYHIGPYQGNDTFFCLKHHFKIRTNDFFQRFEPEYKYTASEYRDYWLKIKAYRANKHVEYLEEMPFSDFKVHDILYKQLPDRIQLQLANSATVRYSQLFDLHHGFEVHCNRGTSGIDGSTSTAIGAAHISEKQTVFITGDLSFFYDTNALWNTHIPSNFRIIILNNSGGGIFRILPKAKESQHFEQFFETRHGLTAEHLASMYGLSYESVSDAVSLQQALAGFFAASAQAKILEVFTPPNINDTVLKEYFRFIA